MLLIGFYSLVLSLMIGVGIAHSVWGIGTISFTNSVYLSLCFVFGVMGVLWMLASLHRTEE